MAFDWEVLGGIYLSLSSWPQITITVTVIGHSISYLIMTRSSCISLDSESGSPQKSCYFTSRNFLSYNLHQILFYRINKNIYNVFHNRNINFFMTRIPSYFDFCQFFAEAILFLCQLRDYRIENFDEFIQW